MALGGAGWASPTAARRWPSSREAGVLLCGFGDVVAGEATVGRRVEVALRLPPLVEAVVGRGEIALRVEVVVGLVVGRGAPAAPDAVAGRLRFRPPREPRRRRRGAPSGRGPEPFGVAGVAAPESAAAGGCASPVGSEWETASLRNGVVGHGILLSSRVHLEGARERVGFQRLQPRAVALDPLCSANRPVLGEDDAVVRQRIEHLTRPGAAGLR